ncbi:MAG: hypothetical protein HY313_03415 [Acidobacteria bacterium]|nr:hypothetical protein [Acidobacteriota bacterium]
MARPRTPRPLASEEVPVIALPEETVVVSGDVKVFIAPSCGTPVSPEPSPEKAVALTVPLTSSFWVGLVVPMPTLPLSKVQVEAVASRPK